MVASKRRSASTWAVSRRDEGKEPRNARNRKGRRIQVNGSQHEHSRKGSSVKMVPGLRFAILPHMTFAQAGFVEATGLENVMIGARLGPNPTVFDLGGGRTQGACFSGIFRLCQPNDSTWARLREGRLGPKRSVFRPQLLHLVIPGGHAEMANALGLRDPNGNWSTGMSLK